MRYASREGAPFAKGNMTPMIDMTFQLIAFFMVLINFTEADQNQAINLPSSELADPDRDPLESAITLQLTAKTDDREARVIFGATETAIDKLQPLVLREAQIIDATEGRDVATTTVIIRADKDAEMGQVQEIIRICQTIRGDSGFEKFTLRAKQEEGS